MEYYGKLLQLKLTGCNQDGEFTCDDGQCIKMEERCDQVNVVVVAFLLFCCFVVIMVFFVVVT